MELDADFTEAGSALGAIAGIGSAIQTSVYINDIVEDAFRIASKEFNLSMDALAMSIPKEFHHVYEWDKVGIPSAKLWRNVLRGTGASRKASFEFRPSITPVPRNVFPPSSTGKQLNPEPVYFHAKAWVMEYNIPVHVTPKKAGVLFFDMQKRISTRYGKHVPFIFSPYAHIEFPGGKVHGNFTEAFANWWSLKAPTVIETKAMPRYQADISKIMLESGKASTRSSRTGRVASKSFSIGYDTTKEQTKRALLASANRYRFENRESQ